MAPRKEFEAELNFLLGKEMSGWQATQAHQLSSPMSHFSGLTPPITIQDSFGTSVSGCFNGNRITKLGWEMDVGQNGEETSSFQKIESMCHSQGSEFFVSEIFLTKSVCDDVFTPNLDVLLKLLGGINDPYFEPRLEKACGLQAPTTSIPKKCQKSKEKNCNQGAHDAKCLIENALDFSFLQNSNWKECLPLAYKPPLEKVGNTGKVKAFPVKCNFQNHTQLSLAKKSSECKQADFHTARVGFPNSVGHKCSTEKSFSELRFFGSKKFSEKNRLPDAFSKSSKTSAPLTPIPSPQSSRGSPSSFVPNLSKFTMHNCKSNSPDRKESPNSLSCSFLSCKAGNDRTELKNEHSAACPPTANVNVISRHFYACSNCGAKDASLGECGSNGERVCRACDLYRKTYMKERPAPISSKLIIRRRRKKASTKCSLH